MKIRQEIADAILAEGDPLTPKEVSERIGEDRYESIRTTMPRMKEAGELASAKGHGKYDVANKPQGDGTPKAAALRTGHQAGAHIGPLQQAMTAKTQLTLYTDVRPEAGDGTVIFEEGSKVEFEMPTLLLEKLLGFRPPRVMGAMLCKGDSMKPIFEEDDPLLYRPTCDIDSDGNYSFFLDGRLRAKRVELIPGGGYRLISANTRDGYGHYRLVPEGNDREGNGANGDENGHLVNSDTQQRVSFQPAGKILWPRRDTGRLHIDQVADLLHSVVKQSV